MSHVPHPSRRVDRRLRRRLEMQAQEEENRDDDEDDGRDELVCDSHEEGQLLLLQQECTSLVERLEKYEYLDHTADVQLHAWGSTLVEAFENVATAMYGYMTELDTVEIDLSQIRHVRVESNSMDSLLYSFLEELLYLFNTSEFIARAVRVDRFDVPDSSSPGSGPAHVEATLFGETWDTQKHPQGTEIKAITFSHMQLWDPIRNPLPEDHELLQLHPSDPAHIYVIVDI